MDCEEEHKRNKVDGFPDDVREAHEHSSNHRSKIESSSSCGCFYCTAIFPPKSIVEWIDENSAGVGQTALCPYCCIDSVIGDKSGFPITKEFLLEMKSHCSFFCYGGRVARSVLGQQINFRMRISEFDCLPCTMMGSWPAGSQKLQILNKPSIQFTSAYFPCRIVKSRTKNI